MDNIKITIETNAEQASKSFEDLAKSFKNTDNQAVDLRKEIRGLKDELYKLEPGTEEYGRVLQELGGKMDQLKDTQEELRVATGGLDTVFQATTNATATMAAGFTAAQGVIALFGGESEDLQKTFVKLQAVMSITTGLKGFAAFGKETKKASTSLKAYISQMRLARTATQQQATATTTLATAEGAASGAALGLSGAIKSVTAAIAANPIGAVLVAITAAITAITHFVGAAKEAREQTEKYNEVLEKSKGTHKTFIEQLEEANNVTDRRIARLKALGTSEEELNKIRKESLELTASQLRHQKQILESNIELYKSNTKMAESLEKWASELDEVNSKLKDTQDELNGMQDVKLPDFVTQIDKGFSDLTRRLNRQVTAGLLTPGQKIQRQIDYYNEEIAKLEKKRQEAMAKRDLPLNSPSFNTEQDAIITETTQTILKLQRSQDDLREAMLDENAKTAKAVRDNTNKLKREMSDAYDKFIVDVTPKLDYWQSLEKIIGKSKAQARMSEELSGLLNPLRENLAKILTSGNGKAGMDELYKAFNEYMDPKSGKFATLLKDKRLDFSGWPIGIETMELRLKTLSGDFIKMNKDAQTALSEGKISTEEYDKWITDAVISFGEQRAKLLSDANKTIEQTIKDMDLPEDEAEKYRKQWTELFNFSAELLPPEEAKKITDAIWNALSKGLEKADAEFDSIINKMNTDMNLAANSWIRGKGDFGIISKILFGAGDSPTKIYEQAQKQAQDVYNILSQRYNREIEMATEKAEIMKALYGEESAEYKKYADEITRLQALLTQAQINYEAEQVENAEDYAEKIKGAATSTFDAISGLTSAMGSYYAEQAERAKETYGENSAEYQKYLKKEGNMKIAQVWSDWAMGVMAAWAANAKYGVASYVLAALQTAALTATAIASTAQIKRQTKASNNGGGSANVGQLTDRVIMADAQRADQTAELNAKYNQGATRVYVTTEDINSKQGETKTAVTSNIF